jgi:hypothetical protein
MRKTSVDSIGASRDPCVCSAQVSDLAETRDRRSQILGSKHATERFPAGIDPRSDKVPQTDPCRKSEAFGRAPPNVRVNPVVDGKLSWLESLSRALPQVPWSKKRLPIRNVEGMGWSPDDSPAALLPASPAVGDWNSRWPKVIFGGRCPPYDLQRLPHMREIDVVGPRIFDTCRIII